MIELEKCYDKEGNYMGKLSVSIKTLTPEFLKKIEDDKDDKMGWKKYKKILKEKGYASE